LIYLPPYSPDFSPIEIFGQRLKKSFARSEQEPINRWRRQSQLPSSKLTSWICTTGLLTAAIVPHPLEKRYSFFWLFILIVVKI
jgi:hypothetical protein